MVNWEPRVTLVTAERVVNFPRIDSHITERRGTLERSLAGPMRALADSVSLLGIPSMKASEKAHDRLFRGLAATYLFGFREARREITALRRSKQDLIAETVPQRLSDVGPYLGQFTATLLHELLDTLAKYRNGLDEDVMLQVRVRERATRLAHNLVLESIGQVLNAGRTLAALGNDEPIIAERPPARWAMRSEQLDQNTCAPCDDLHGSSAEIGTLAYFALLPPTGCLGRGRCRGVMVYSDDPADFLTL